LSVAEFWGKYDRGSGARYLFDTLVAALDEGMRREHALAA
jgi:hypothetical protein